MPKSLTTRENIMGKWACAKSDDVRGTGAYTCLVRCKVRRLLVTMSACLRLDMTFRIFR